MYAPEDLDRLCDVRQELLDSGIEPGTEVYREAMECCVDSGMVDSEERTLIVIIDTEKYQKLLEQGVKAASAVAK